MLWRYLAATVCSAVLVGLAVLVPVASAAPRTVIFDLFGTPLSKPDKVFLTANKGPYLKDLKWSNWGDATATGTGVHILDCTNGGFGCAPDAGVITYPARYVLSAPAPCPRFGPDARAYRRGVIFVEKDGEEVRRPFSPDYDFCAKRPTLAAGRAAVERHVRRHRHARAQHVSCRVANSTSLDCSASWERGGRVRRATFNVYARVGGRIVVRPFG